MPSPVTWFMVQRALVRKHGHHQSIINLYLLVLAGALVDGINHWKLRLKSAKMISTNHFKRLKNEPKRFYATWVSLSLQGKSLHKGPRREQQRVG